MHYFLCRFDFFLVLRPSHSVRVMSSWSHCFLSRLILVQPIFFGGPLKSFGDSEDFKIYNLFRLTLLNKVFFIHFRLI